MDIAAWLQGLGFARYVPAFRDNEIDWEVLPKLTSEDLREIGVAAIGHRRKLLDAIAALGATVPTAAVTAAPSDAPAPTDAERRQLTVTFCDLVGSTALAARLDPEDLREVYAAYHRAVAEVVAGFDGFVAKYMGDGVLIYFGYPRAHEDDAERAVRAGLGVIDTVGRLDVKSVKLQARVGIATGLVVVGDLIGEGSAQEQSVVGETPNLAARLQALAEPNAVVIAAGTRRLVGDLFEYRDLGAVEVKGLAAPVPASQVLRPSVVASRFEALRGSALTPLVGRDEEIDLLLRRWARAKAGDGQVVLISGEPGLNRRGYSTGKGNRWNQTRVATARRNHSIAGQRRALPDPERVSLSQAARISGVSHRTIERLVEAGLLKFEQVTPRAPWEIHRSDLDAEPIRRIVDRLHRTGKLILQWGCAEDQPALFTENQGDDNARHHE
jgi:class 3 adenylate cyclase